MPVRRLAAVPVCLLLALMPGSVSQGEHSGRGALLAEPGERLWPSWWDGVGGGQGGSRWVESGGAGRDRASLRVRKERKGSRSFLLTAWHSFPIRNYVLGTQVFKCTKALRYVQSRMFSVGTGWLNNHFWYYLFFCVRRNVYLLLKEATVDLSSAVCSDGQLKLKEQFQGLYNTENRAWVCSTRRH